MTAAVSTETGPSPKGRTYRTRFPGGTRLRDGHHISWWAELVGILAFYLVYSAIRNSVNQNADLAFEHARELISWQRNLGAYFEPTLQNWTLHFQPLVVAMNYAYGSLHFVVTGGVGIYLFRRWSNDYPRWRNTLVITTSIALIGFISWPLMPPRLLPGSYGFVDTLAKYPTLWSFDSGQMAKLSNQFAAMPSVHCAWALFCAAALVPRLRHRWAKVLAGLYPVFTVVVIVLTANHYWLDAVGGFAIFGVGYLGGRLFTRAGRGAPVVDPSLSDSSPDEPAAAALAHGGS